jgi:hypothetical protein
MRDPKTVPKDLSLTLWPEAEGREEDKEAYSPYPGEGTVHILLIN